MANAHNAGERVNEQSGLGNSLLGFYIDELVARRIEADLSQTGLAHLIPTSPAVISRVESGKQLPTYELSVSIDRALGLGRYFQRLWPLVAEQGAPSWYRPIAEIEGKAVKIQTYETQFIPGLFQTEAYARALLSRGISPATTDASVLFRLERQRILTREDPPYVWAIIDESAIRRQVGGTAVMAEQLQQLLSIVRDNSDHVTVQIVPMGSSNYVGSCAFSLYHLTSPTRDFCYEEGVIQGRMTSEPEAVDAAQRFYDLLRAAALPPDASLKLIEAALKDLEE